MDRKKWETQMRRKCQETAGKGVKTECGGERNENIDKRYIYKIQRKYITQQGNETAKKNNF